ncbi:hypothetical protein R8O28_004758 [Citrobacter freundii]|nr:hypothetical protein [Citrobacter freundii]
MTDFIDKLAANGVAFTLQDGRIIVEGDLRVGFTLEPEDPAIPCDYIPANLTVTNTLTILSGIHSIPAGLVARNLFISYSELESLPDNLTITGTLMANSSRLKYLPENLTVGRVLDIMCTDIAYLPDTLKVAGSMMLSNTRITTLPDNLHLEENLALEAMPLQALPKNLKVGHSLYLEAVALKRIPECISCPVINLVNPGNFENVASVTGIGGKPNRHVYALRTALGVRVCMYDLSVDPEIFGLLVRGIYDEPTAELLDKAAQQCIQRLEDMYASENAVRH